MCAGNGHQVEGHSDQRLIQSQRDGNRWRLGAEQKALTVDEVYLHREIPVGWGKSKRLEEKGRVSANRNWDERRNAG